MVVRISIGVSHVARVAALAARRSAHRPAPPRCRAPGRAPRNPRHPRPGDERQRHPEGHVHFQVVAFRLRHQREPEPVAAQRGDSEQTARPGSQSAWPAPPGTRAMSPRRQQKSRRGRRQVDALHGVGLEVVGHARGIGADHGDRRPATSRAAPARTRRCPARRCGATPRASACGSPRAGRPRWRTPAPSRPASCSRARRRSRGPPARNTRAAVWSAPRAASPMARGRRHIAVRCGPSP